MLGNKKTVKFKYRPLTFKRNNMFKGFAKHFILFLCPHGEAKIKGRQARIVSTIAN